MSATALSPALLLGYAGWLALLLHLALRLQGRRGEALQRWRRAWLLTPLLLPLAWLLRGACGDPSLCSTLLLGWLFWQARRPAADAAPVWPWPLALLLLTVGVALQASALGPWRLDLYALGDQRDGVVGLLALMGLLAGVARAQGSVLGWIWPAACVLYGLGGALSPNLWDALLDPGLLLAALFSLLRAGVVRASARI
ncbi:MAG: hypothetical protein RJA44_1661, partial [Pseudomonadota bacterium]